MIDRIICDKHGDNVTACFVCNHIAEGYPKNIRIALDKWDSWVAMCEECAKKGNELTPKDIQVSCIHCIIERLKDILLSVDIKETVVIQ